MDVTNIIHASDTNVLHNNNESIDHNPDEEMENEKTSISKNIPNEYLIAIESFKKNDPSSLNLLLQAIQNIVQFGCDVSSHVVKIPYHSC